VGGLKPRRKKVGTDLAKIKSIYTICSRKKENEKEFEHVKKSSKRTKKRDAQKSDKTTVGGHQGYQGVERRLWRH
jgi:hypothetical protein